MPRDKRLVYERKWLNPKGWHSSAFVFVDVAVSKWKNRKGETRYDVDGEVTISDCSRQIRLSVSKDKRDIKKLTILIDTLTRTRDALANWKEPE